MANTSRFAPDPGAVAGLLPQDPWWLEALQRVGLEASVLTSRADSSVPSSPADPERPRDEVGPAPVLPLSDGGGKLDDPPGTALPLPLERDQSVVTDLVAGDPLSQAVATLARGSGGGSWSLDSVVVDDGHVQGSRCSCPACAAAPGQIPGGRSSATKVTGSAPSSAPAAAASLQTLANYLTLGYWQENGTYTRKFNLTSSGTAAKNGVITYNLTGWADDANGLSSERQALAREVFKVYSAALGISFREVTGAGGDIRFRDNDSGAYAYMASGWYADSTRTKVITDYSVVNVASDWYYGLSGNNTYSVQTFFHEIGHALGLGHQGFYNGSGSYSTDAKFANDSWQESMMSYFSQTANPTTGASYAFLQTPMAVDWIGLNDLYRSQGYSTDRAFQGDTIYGVGTNISASISDIWNTFSTYAGVSAYTLVDGSGYDTLDVSNFTANQLINLAPSQLNSTTPSISSIGGKTGNLTIAAGTIIEAAKGGSGNDSFYGNAAANAFHGNGGNDSFYDSFGSDVYFGGDGGDWLYFSESIDLLSYSLSGDSLLFARRYSSADVDRVWKGLENLSFNGVAYTYDQLLASVVTNPPPQPTATLSLANGVGSSVNEGSSVSINIATANLAQGASVYWQLSGVGVNTSDFVGLSSLTGSVSTDASGKAALNLGIRADATTEGNELMGFALFSDAGLTNKLAGLSLTIQDTSLTPVVSNLTIWGTTGRDTLSGGAGNDRITGVLASGTTAAAMGANQIDRLTGQAGADVFLVGDSRGVFYDDRAAGDVGAADYALITDFKSGEDKLQLANRRYFTSLENGGLSLYWDRNNNGSLNTSGSSRDELIAVLQGVTGLAGSDILWV